MKILIKVDCKEGEESMWLSDIEESELDLVAPLIRDIKLNNGYWPEGAQQYPGYLEIKNRLPSPPSGIERISEIYVFSNDLFSLIM